MRAVLNQEQGPTPVSRGVDGDRHLTVDRVPTLALVIATAAVYFAAAKLGLSMAFAADQVTAVWPPTGIAIAVLVVLGPRAWPGVLLGAFLANATAAEPVATAAGIAVGNTLEAVVAVALLRRVGFRAAIDRLRDALALVGAGLASATVSATIGVISLCAGGVQPWHAFASLWWIWIVGDTMGALVVAPVLLVWSALPARRWTARRLAEAAALVVAVVLLSAVVFAGWGAFRITAYPLQYTVFPLVAWAALRFGPRGTALLTLLVSGIAIWSTVHGWGPFAVGTIDESLVLLQLFMAVVAVSGLVLAAAIVERNRAVRRRLDDYAKLEVSEQRLRLALEAGRMGVWEWNIASGAVWWSDTLEPLYGLAPGAFSNTFEAFQSLIHPDDRDTVNAAISRAVEKGSGYDVEFRVLAPDGMVRWMAGTGKVVRDARGRAVRMIGVGLDVSERHRLAAELRVHVEQLADAGRRKDEFLAMLAHELRNPLAALTTALHLLDIDGIDRKRSVQVAGRQLRQLEHLVDDLLDVSRISRGKITLRREAVLVADIVQRALETVRGLIDTRGHTLTVSLPADPVVLDADPARLVQVLGNLLTNAAKYTAPHGSIWMTGERVGDELLIRVRDSGVGLAPSLLPYVFDLFVQGTSTGDRARGGLGIGLTVVQRLVEMHGGRVEALSAGVGAGSEFLVHLPVAQNAVPVVADERLPPRERAAARRLKLLVVEDNQDAAESLAMVLELWGHEVRMAFDGLAALEIAVELGPDVIISDLGLPGIDGFELARRLRHDGVYKGAVLIALSGYGRDDDKRRAFDAGFDHHLVKPPDLEALAALIGRVGTNAGAGSARTLH